METIFVGKGSIIQSLLPPDVQPSSRRAGRLHAAVRLGEGSVENQVGLARERFFTPRPKFKPYDEPDRISAETSQSILFSVQLGNTRFSKRLICPRDDLRASR